MQSKLLHSYYLLTELRHCQIRVGLLPIKLSFSVWGIYLPASIVPSYCKKPPWTFDGRQPLLEGDLDGRWLFMGDNLWWKMTINWVHPLMEDDLMMEDKIWWKTTFNEICPLMGIDLWWKTWLKTTFDGKQLGMEDNLDRRWHLMGNNIWWKDDNLWWKMSFDERQPLIDNDLWLTTPFDQRQALMEC